MLPDVNPTLVPRHARRTDSRILFVVLDGLGGVIGTPGGTALERARHPNLDRLATAGALGRYVPISPGITPGSGPGHFSIFGYDPLGTEVGRGVLEAMGLGVEMKPGDVAARANYATVGADGKLTDRRAGRIPTEEASAISAALGKSVAIA